MACGCPVPFSTRVRTQETRDRDCFAAGLFYRLEGGGGFFTVLVETMVAISDI